METKVLTDAMLTESDRKQRNAMKSATQLLLAAIVRDHPRIVARLTNTRKEA